MVNGHVWFAFDVQLLMNAHTFPFYDSLSCCIWIWAFRREQ